ncbi:amino acid racemase [Altericroceibacterium spongiae]|uniref:Amino acid racemase n=1 Tax=Altericroceibacterium spongiae TaxID=2320269 RepID=A0A420EMJ9_9SPHN|nr:amino acid racemase [Altericroceibacterium spongiae]RKF21942.1 amino acid racemase [Altericroceibacterium spongiae]
MRKLGLIGGMSWVSTGTYYTHINQIVQARKDRRSSAPLLIESLDFSRLYAMESDQDWENAAGILTDSAKRLEQAGAEALIIGANSMHRVYDRICDAVEVPIFHIADCVGERMKADGITNSALIGSSNVMTESFFRERLVAHGIDLAPPNLENLEQLDRIIYEELMIGKVTRDAERQLKTMITVKEQEGIESIVLACTELEQIVDVDANVLPIYDSTRIHAEKAAEWLLASD